MTAKPTLILGFGWTHFDQTPQPKLKSEIAAENSERPERSRPLSFAFGLDEPQVLQCRLA